MVCPSLTRGDTQLATDRQAGYNIAAPRPKVCTSPAASSQEELHPSSLLGTHAKLF